MRFYLFVRADFCSKHLNQERSEKLENEEGKSVEYTHYYSFTPFVSDKSFTVTVKAKHIQWI